MENELQDELLRKLDQLRFALSNTVDPINVIHLEGQIKEVEDEIKSRNMKKEIPILFSTAMVQAILAGRKTMTRRVVKFPLKCPTHQVSIGDNGQAPPARWAKWQPGDLIWVRETWGIYDRPDTPVYKAGEDGWDDIAREQVRFKPSIHMPKSMCRIWLEVTNVRAERLQEISESDAIAEGVESWVEERMKSRPTHYKVYCDLDNPNDPATYSSTAKVSFESLWHKINGKESWEANPWVWVVSFKVLSTTGKPNSNQ